MIRGHFLRLPREIGILASWNAIMSQVSSPGRALQQFCQCTGLGTQAGKPKPAEAAKPPLATSSGADDGGQPTADDGYRENDKHANGATKAGTCDAALQMVAPTRVGFRSTSTAVLCRRQAVGSKTLLINCTILSLPLTPCWVNGTDQTPDNSSCCPRVTCICIGSPGEATCTRKRLCLRHRIAQEHQCGKDSWYGFVEVLLTAASTEAASVC